MTAGQQATAAGSHGPVRPSRSGFEGPSRSSRYAILFACLLLGVPGCGVVQRAVESRGVEASQGAAQPAAPLDVRSLEEREDAAPTADNRLNLSVAYINGGAAERAIPILESLVAGDKDNARAWNNLCVARTLRKDYGEAIAACSQALRVDPNFQLAANNLRWALGEQEKAGRNDR
jgi:tetratricopeptide (TPR) repeat protein